MEWKEWRQIRVFFGLALNGEERLLSGQGEEEGSELEPGPYKNEW